MFYGRGMLSPIHVVGVSASLDYGIVIPKARWYSIVTCIPKFGSYGMLYHRFLEWALIIAGSVGL